MPKRSGSPVSPALSDLAERREEGLERLGPARAAGRLGLRVVRVLFDELAEVLAAARAHDELAGERLADLDVLVGGPRLNAQREDARLGHRVASRVADPAVVRGARVGLGHTHAAAHAELNELSLEELATNLVAVVLFGEALALRLVQEVGHADPLRGGDVLDAVVDLLGRHGDARFVGRDLLEAIVDHAREKLADLVRLGGGLLRGRRVLGRDGHEVRARAVPELREQDGAVADDRDDALDDGSLGHALVTAPDRGREPEPEGPGNHPTNEALHTEVAPSTNTPGRKPRRPDRT